MKTKQLFLLIFWFAVVDGGSATADPLTKRDIARIHVKRWELIDVRSRHGESMSPDSLCGNKNSWITIDFKTNGEVDGTMCCNSFSGKYEISPGSNNIAIFDFSTTSLGCLPKPTLEDSDFLPMIDGIWKAELANSELLLHSAVGDAIWRYRPETGANAPKTADGSGPKPAK